jgi:hypothetical protein
VDPIVDLLDRQADFLLEQVGDETFLFQVEPFLRAISADGVLALYLEDLRDELIGIIQVLEAIDAELVPQLVELREDLVRLRPDADDSDATPPVPRPGVPDMAALLRYQDTLAHFDERAKAEAQPFNHMAEGGNAAALLSILQKKDLEYLRRIGSAEVGRTDDDLGSPTGPADVEIDTRARVDLGGWRMSLGNVDRRYRHVQRWARLRMRTSGGLALLRLEAAKDAMQPPLRLMDPEVGAMGLMGEMLKLVGSSEFSLLRLADGDPLSSIDDAVIADRVADLRNDVRRLQEDLRRRVNTTRSRRALVERFKLRCEWHDRERLVAVAEDKELGGGPEDRLTAEFARYLFDQGLSPLSKPMTGGLQPDLLDPGARFYVEAKQYNNSGSRRDIVKAVAQVMDTVGRLRGGQYAVDEAFCVIFRRSGPYYDLPASLRTHGYRIHLLLVDLASADEAGRRQRERPVVIEPSEFLDATGDPER